MLLQETLSPTADNTLTHADADPSGTAVETGSRMTSWLQNYTAQSSLFVSPSCSLLAQGCLLQGHFNDAQGRLARQVDDLLEQAKKQGLSQPIVMGVIAFDPCSPGYFHVPTKMKLGGPLLQPLQPPAAQSSNNRVVQHRLQPGSSQYEYMVERALNALAQPPLEKIVLARQAILQLQNPLNRKLAMQNMLYANPAGYTFMLPLEHEAHNHDPESFFGISPELLVRRQGRQLIANPLAGTCARDTEPGRDQALALDLLHSDKDRREHAFVVDAVRRALQVFCDDLQVPASPSLRSTHNLWHLSTQITGRLRDPGTTSLQLALALQPTPAVGGTPTEQAMSVIRQIEPFERQLYAGAVGWQDSQGNGEWAVAIRCAHYRNKTLTLTAGAGIVPGSDPALEYIETGNKLQSLLATLGLKHAIDILQKEKS